MIRIGPLLVVLMKPHIQECRQVIISLRYAIRGMYLIRNIGIFLFRYISFLLVSIGGGLFGLFDHFLVAVRVRDIFTT